MELPLLRPRSKISLETIEYQNDNIGADMEQIVGSLQRKILDGVYTESTHISGSKEVRDLTNVIMERFGLLVKFIVEGGIAAVLPFYVNRNHIFLRNYARGQVDIKKQTTFLETAHGKKGTVNLQKARVGGFFSECEILLVMNFDHLFKVYKLTPAEAVAILFHELGHAFTVFEYSDRLEVANQVLQDVAKVVTSKKTSTDRVYIYRQLKTLNAQITEAEVEKLVSGNRIIGDLTWFKLVIGTVTSQLTNEVYSRTSSEQMADNFVSRMGYYRAFVSGYEKTNSLAELEKDKSLIKTRQLTDIISITLPIVLAAVTSPALLSLALLTYLVTFAVLASSGENHKDYTYDELKIRYKRVRNEAVNRLKDLNCPTEVVRPILDDIYFMDKIISETYRVSLASEKIANFIFKSAKDAKASVDEQQLLEDLAMNDLFIASAELRTLNT